MAKDVLGNELNVGDLVRLDLDKPMVYGKITKINPGGIAIVGGMKAGQKGEQITLGSVEVAVDANATFDPRNGQAPGVCKVYDPEEGRRTGILQ